MNQRFSQNKTVWLFTGIFVGLCIANIWPHEPAFAAATDRAEKFAILTVPVGTLEGTEGIFILDFLTGRLSGAVLNPRNGLFTNRYLQNVAADFQIKPGSRPQYAVIAGRASIPNQGRRQMAGGAIYVAEMTTGTIICYGFPYSSSNRAAQFTPLIPIARFPFREAAVD